MDICAFLFILYEEEEQQCFSLQ